MDLGGGDAGYFGVGGAVGVVAGFAEAGGVGGEELGGVAGDGVGEGGDAAFDVDFEVERGVGVFGFGEFDDDGAAGGAAEGVFVHVAEAEAAEEDAAVGRAEARRAGWRRRGGGCARARGRRRWRRRRR